MTPRPRPTARARTSVAAVAALLLAGCSDSPSILEPRSPAAERIAGLWWLMFWISIVVFLVVLAFLVVAVFRAHRPSVESAEKEPRWGEPFIVIAGVVVPSLILAAVFVYSLTQMSALAGSEDDAITIEVIGHYWWWEVVYEDDAITANEIHIPAGEPVRIKLTTADVIHSFWVPQLQAKMDMIPGRTNELWIEAEEPGVYRGQCAEFCGLQHAKMIFLVIAEPPGAFKAWLAEQKEDAAEDGASDFGERVFLTSNCVGCHTIRGTTSASDFGPDLTHFGSRRTIAAGVLPNTRTNLARWIAEPQEIKVGAKMPPATLTEAELDALVDYLEGLK